MSEGKGDRFDDVRAVMAAPEDVDMGDVAAATEGGVTPDPGQDGGPGGADPQAAPSPEEVAGQFPLNDIGNGRRFEVYFGSEVFAVPRVAWFRWVGTHWQRDDDRIQVRKLAQQVSGKIEGEAAFLKLPPKQLDLLARADEVDARFEVLRGIKPDQLSEEQKSEKLKLQGQRDAIASVRDAFRKRKDRHFTHARNTGNSGKIDAMLTEAAVFLNHDLSDLDAEPLAVNTLSGTLRFWLDPGDPDEGLSAEAMFKIDPHETSDLITKCLSTTYDPLATAPKFEAFLTRIQPSAELRGFLQRWFALSMTGRIEQKLAFFYGQGANGKSVLLEVMARLLSSYAASAKIESLTGQSKRGGADATPDLIPLMGARLVRASEPEEGERFKEGMIKELTGGEPILVRALHSDFVEVIPEFKLTISGNHKPEIRGTDDGIWRRVMLVPFDVQIPAEERRDFDELVRDLMTEGPGILNWLVAGLLDYLDSGLQVPDSVVAATAEYRRDSDPIGAFLTEHTVVDGRDTFISASDLVKAFRFWLVQEGDAPWGARTVSNKLKALADRWRHPATGMSYTRGKSGVTGYRGITLTPAFQKAFDERPPDREMGN